MDLKNNIRTENGWEIIEKSFNPEQVVTTGSNFMIGNGYLGYRGTFAEWEAEDFVACIVTDTWDKAPESRWSELCNVPNGLFTQLYVDGEMLSAFSGDSTSYFRQLSLRDGVNSRKVTWQGQKGGKVSLMTEKFASLDQHHLLVMQYTLKAETDAKIILKTGVDAFVWSINGEHYKSQQVINEEGVVGFDLRTIEMDTQICVQEKIVLDRDADSSHIEVDDRRILRSYIFDLQSGDTVSFFKVVCITHSNEMENPLNQGREELNNAIELSYSDLYANHKKQWDKFWHISDILIGGNPEAQLLTRFNIYQAFIATPRHANLPIGARGLSCQVYQGAAFWDQETYNLPMYIYTHPELARNLVTYRHDTLPGARRKAKHHGFYGAFYAWTSGKTGDELFPDFFFTDVLTGRKIRNHFNVWQIHISPDVVYGIWKYYEATKDWDFMIDYGAEVIFEVAQFIRSRVYFKKDKNRYEVIRVLGPDEYHENVDNNAYTNYLIKYSLEKACRIYKKYKKVAPDKFKKLADEIGINDHILLDWQEIADLLYLPQPDIDTHLITQFDGYFQLEDTTPAELKKRLIDPGEYWGWPNGVAVHTQVLKQADVIQLLAMLDGFSDEVLDANYKYYEPRTEHGSSLSPSVHALVACKAGHPKESYRYFMEASTIDLYNASKKVLSGGSFLGGIHTAAAGGVWLIIIQGFAGMEVHKKGLKFRPRLPEQWDSLEFSIVFREMYLRVKIDDEIIEITRSDDFSTELYVYVNQENVIILANEVKSIQYID